MSKYSSLYSMLICSIFCSAAIAAQPTVRAGSISLNSGVKNSSAPAATATANTTHGSALSKLSTTVIPIKGPSNNNTNNNNSSSNSSVSSSTLRDLQNQIDELKDAQRGLADNQITRGDVEDTIEARVKTLDLTTENPELERALSNINTTNSNLQNYLETIQQQTERFTDSLNTDIDNRLKVRGLIDSNNNVSFAKKSDINPETLADNIVRNENATATLAEKIQPKESDIKDIIADDLQDREIINKDGSLNVEKRGAVTVSESTVLGAINNSANFKDLVANAANEKGYVKSDSDTIKSLQTTVAKAITTDNLDDTLSDKKVITTNNIGSNDIRAAIQNAGFARTADVVTTEGFKAKLKSDLVDNEVKNTLSEAGFAKTADVVTTEGFKAKLKSDLADEEVKSTLTKAGFATTADIPDVTVTDDMIANALSGTSTLDNAVIKNLKEKQILDSDGTTLKVATKAEISADALETTLKDKFAKKGEVGIDESAVTNLLKNKQILADDGTTLKVATKDDVSTNSLKNKLKDEFALKGENVTISNEDIAAALSGTDTLDNAVIKNLKEKQILDSDGTTLKVATKAEIKNLASNSAIETLRGGINESGSILNTVYANKDALGLKGEKGEKGDPGLNGSSFNYKGEVETYSSLPSSCNQSDAYLVLDTNLLYICSCEDSTCAFGNGVQFGQKGDPGESAWHAYCMQHKAIVVALYPDTVDDCSNFDSDRYNTIMGGADAYCISLAKDINASRIDLSVGVGKRLSTKLVAADSSKTISNLKGQSLETILNSRFNGNMKFIEACKAKFNEIMAGEDAEKPEITYCKSPAANYSDGTLNRDLARKLYPNASIADDCSNFTAEMYAGMVGGAQAFCSNLTATFEKVDLTKGAGLKLAKVYATKKNVSLDNAKTALTTLQGKAPAARLADTSFSILQNCIDNYNSIMNGEDAEKPEVTYCKSAAANYTDGTLNRDLARKLYPNASIADDCSNFTAEMYAGMVGGAQAFCSNLTATFNKVDLTKGTGLKLAKVYAAEKKVSLDSAKTALTTLQGKTPAARLADTNFSILQKCIDNYNSIMNGDDAEKPEITYCKAQAANYSSGTLNRDLARKLYPNASIADDCSNFTAEMYAGMVGGAQAFCSNFTATFNTVDLTQGAGLRMAKVYAAAKNVSLANAKTALTTLQGKTPAARLSDTSFSLLDNCIANYNSIMNGEDGDDGKDAARIWCEAHLSSGAARLSPAKMLRVYNKNTSVASKITISNNTGYFTDLNTCLAAVAADPSLMGGESASDLDFNNNNTISALNSTILDKFNTHRNSEFIASLHGSDGKNGTDGKNGADGKTYMPVIDKGMLSWKVDGANAGIEAVKIQGENGKDGKDGAAGKDGKTYMPVIDKGMLSWKVDGANAGIEAVKIQGENGKDGADGKTYMPVIDKEGMLSWKVDGANAGIEAVKIQGKDGKDGKDGTNGTDGKTWRPTFTNGQISWTQSNDSSAISNFDVKATALAGVKEELGGNSSSSLTSLVNAKATAAANSAIGSSNSVLTAQDLVNLINSNALTVSNSKVTLASNPTVSTSAQGTSLGKLSGSGTGQGGASMTIQYTGSCTANTCGPTAAPVFNP